MHLPREPDGEAAARHGAVERALEIWLFRARWLMAPFYVGMVVALAALLYVFALELWHGLSHIAGATSGQAIIMALSLIDLSLTGNLLLVVIFSGYENFVSRIDMGQESDRLAWMGGVDFSGLKLKLIASMVAITGIALLRGFLQMVQGEGVQDHMLAWLAALHVIFVVSSLLLSLSDWIAARSKRLLKSGP